MTYFWELAASYFSGARKALKPTICQSLRAINMWFCHPRSFSLAFAFAILGLGVLFLLFLKSLWERANLIQPMVPCATWACSYTTFGPRTTEELGGFAMKPQAWDAGHLGSSPPQHWPVIHVFLSPWGKRSEFFRWILSILLNSEGMVNPFYVVRVVQHQAQSRLGHSQEVFN